jgi:hypothetical protein
VSTEEEYDAAVLEHNFYSKPKSYFCLVQQISPEDIQKYFIFGIKFQDFVVTPINTKKGYDDEVKSDFKINKNNYVNIFKYEKTYLFISYEPLYQLFQKIFENIFQIKKLNFLHNMSEFSCIFIKDCFLHFNKENNEKEGEQINELLYHFYKKSFPKYNEILTFNSQLNNTSLEYQFPSLFNINFLAIDWLSKMFFTLIDPTSLFTILIKILNEQSIIFVSDNIQSLTTSVLGFTNLIAPFTWPFIVIPNLPHDLRNMIDSPVPYLIGILGNEDVKKDLVEHGSCDVVYISDIKVELSTVNKNDFEEPYIKNLKALLIDMMDSLYFNDNIYFTCEKIYKKIFDSLKSEIAFKIEKIAKQDIFKLEVNESNAKKESSILNTNQYDQVRQMFEKSLNMKDLSFGKAFSQTQLFLNYFEDMRVRKFSNF